MPSSHLKPTRPPHAVEEEEVEGAGVESEEDREAARACARAIVSLMPDEVSLENVWGYRNFDSFKIITDALKACGYHVGYWHLNAADYGVPQTRKRLILLASLKGRPHRPAPTHSKHGDLFTAPWVGWLEAIEDLIPALPESKFAAWQLKRLVPMFVSHLVTEQYAGDNSNPERTPVHVKGDTPAPTVLASTTSQMRAYLVESKNSGSERGDMLRESDEPCTTITTDNRPSHWPKAFIVDGKPANYEGDLQITGGDCHNGTVTASQTRHPFRAFLAQGTSTLDMRDADEPSACVVATAHTKAAKPRAWLSAGRVVSMTPRALARFQSIPVSVVLPDSNGLACKVIGNAVPSLLAQRLVESRIEARARAAA